MADILISLGSIRGQLSHEKVMNFVEFEGETSPLGNYRTKRNSIFTSFQEKHHQNSWVTDFLKHLVCANQVGKKLTSNYKEKAKERQKRELL